MPRTFYAHSATGEIQGFAVEEHDDERQARITRENLEHAHKLWKDKIVFLIVIGAGALLFAICVYILLFAGSSADPVSRDLAKIGITSLFTGFVAFLAGQRVG